MALESTPKQITFNVLIEKMGTGFVAHCLEAGLVAHSDDANELPHKMAKMLVRQIEFAVKNNNYADIFHSAPSDVWARYFEAQAQIESTKKQLKVDHFGGLVLNQNAYAACAAS